MSTSNRLISVLFKGKTWSIDFSLFLIGSSLESLPNELLFMIKAHMSSSDLLQAFYGLNHRFKLIVYQSARHFTISKDTNETMFAKLKPNIKKMIEKICIDAQLLSHVFLSTYSYSNLRSVVLHCANFTNFHLNVDCDSAKCTIQSCLDVLRKYESGPQQDVQVCILKYF